MLQVIDLPAQVGLQRKVEQGWTPAPGWKVWKELVTL